MMNQTILFALLLAFGGPAPATEWVSVAKSNGKELFVDVASIQVTGNIARAWVKLVPPPRTVREDESQAAKAVLQYLVHDAINCDEHISRRDASTLYYEDGTNTAVPTNDFPDWRPIRPDTMESMAMQFICALRPSDAVRVPQNNTLAAATPIAASASQRTILTQNNPGLILIWVLLAAVVASWAVKRGRSGIGYFSLGMIMSPFAAWLIVAILPRKFVIESTASPVTISWFEHFHIALRIFSDRVRRWIRP